MRLKWWNARADFIKKFESDAVGKSNYIIPRPIRTYLPAHPCFPSICAPAKTGAATPGIDTSVDIRGVIGVKKESGYCI